jgi:tRNA threonylcarbamoyladenosine biosynthesis protein TsaE
MLIRWRSRSAEETRRLGARLAERLRPDRALLLEGELGAGKTVLVQGLAAGLGVAPAEVQSPTFILWREHLGSGARLLHLDLYRLAPGEAAALGMEELLAGPGVKAVEWAERLPFPVAGALRLRLRRLPDETREIVELP